jgi:hypothetical protein
MFVVLSNVLSYPVAGAGFGFGQSNLSGRVIVLILVVGSVWAWSLMVSKWKDLRTAARESDRFILMLMICLMVEVLPV